MPRAHNLKGRISTLGQTVGPAVIKSWNDRAGKTFTDHQLVLCFLIFQLRKVRPTKLSKLFRIIQLVAKVGPGPSLLPSRLVVYT